MNRLPGWRRLTITILSMVFILLLIPYSIREVIAQEQQPPSSSEQGDDEDIAEFALPIPKPWTGDFDGMKEKRLIRILVPYSKPFFFLDKGSKRVTAYDLGTAFESWLNKKFKMKTLKIHALFIPTARDRLIPGLIEGLGDIAAGNLTITPDRSKRVDFSIPGLKDVKELVVTGPSAPPLNMLKDLGGNEIFLRRSISYYGHLVALNKTLKRKIILKAAEEEMEDEDLLEMVDAALLPMVVVDDHKANFWTQVFDDITVREDLPINTGGRIAWAVRKNSPLLLAEINDFLKKHVKRTGLGNILLRRYLRSTKYVKNALSEKEMKQFQRVVDLFKKSGLNPNVWFGNVEHAAARIIGRETVQYVSNIYKDYTAYKLIEHHRMVKS